MNTQNKNNKSVKGNKEVKNKVEDLQNNLLDVSENAKNYLAKFGVNEKEVSKGKREHLYIYPVEITDINSKNGKSFRQKRRNELKGIVERSLVFFAYNRTEDLKNEIAKFEKIYKEFYRVNDYSIGSVSNNTEEKQGATIEFLKIVKSLKEEQK